MSKESPLSQLEIEPLPEGWTPIAVVALIKCRTADGWETWSFRTSDDLSEEEALGAMIVRADHFRARLVESFTDLD